MPSIGDVCWHVAAAFGKSWRNEPVTTGWTDLSDRVRAYTHKRGRNAESGNMQAGTATITLDNRDRALDPTNSAGPHAGQLLPGVPLRVTATYASTTHPVFYGYVEQWPIAWDGLDATVDIDVIDLLGVFAGLPAAESLWHLWALTQSGRAKFWWRMSAENRGAGWYGSAIPDASGHGNIGGVTRAGTGPAPPDDVVPAPSLADGDQDGALAFTSRNYSYPTGGSGTIIVNSLGSIGVASGPFDLTFRFRIHDSTGAATHNDNHVLFRQSNVGSSVISIDIEVSKPSASSPGVVVAALRDSANNVLAVCQDSNRVDDGATHTLHLSVSGTGSAVSMSLIVDGNVTPSPLFSAASYAYGRVQVGPCVGFNTSGVYDRYTIDEVFMVVGLGIGDWHDMRYADGNDSDWSAIWWSLDASERAYVFCLLGGIDLFNHPTFVTFPPAGTTVTPPGLTDAPGNVLAAITDCTAADRGVFYARRDGTARLFGFAERTSDARYSTVQATLAAPAASGEYPVVSAAPVAGDIDQVINRATGSVSTRWGTGTYDLMAFAEDTASQATYGLRVETMPIPDADRAEAIVARYKDPGVRFPTVELAPLMDPGLASWVLGCELQDRVRVKASPPGGGSALSVDAHIQGERVDFDPRNGWKVTLQLDRGL